MPYSTLPNPYRTMSQRTRRSQFLRRFSVAVLAVTTLVACRSEDALRAVNETTTDTLTAYAMTGTPIQYPSALNSIARTTVPVSGVGAFDVAFDFDPATPNEIQILPIRQIITPFSSSIPSVGLLARDEAFEDISRAPDTTYRLDSTLVVAPGQPFIIQSFRSVPGVLLCVYLVTPRVYTKVVIDSVNTTTRAIYLRQTLNPNCGYRSFLEGLPSS